MKIMSFWLAKVHQLESVADVTSCLNDLSARGACRKTESAGKGILSSGEKNFSVHRTYINFSRPRKRASEAVLYDLWGSLLPENGTNAKPFLSEVYKKGTRASKRLAGVSLYSFRWILPQNVPDTTQPDDDVSPRGAYRKTESAGNGVLSSGEKNFSVHKTYMNFSRPLKKAPETALYTLRGSLLPENGTNATPFSSDVYNLGTRRGRMLVDGALSGRSMVEMLGVLAIIGVLSVGAIAGYQKAMFKYKINKTVQQLTFLTNGLLQSEGLMREMSNLQLTRLAPYVQKFNLLPDGMTITDNDVLLDALGNRCKPFTRSSHLVIDYVLSYNWKAQQNADICFSLIQNFVQPLHEHMYQVWLYRSIDNTGGDPNSNRLHWYGDKYCTGSQQCLKNMTLENMTSTCQSCIENSDCILSIELL